MAALKWSIVDYPPPQQPELTWEWPLIPAAAPVYPAVDTVDLWDTTGFAVEGYDLGFPTRYDVVDRMANASGEIDSTMYHGARIVTLDVRLTGSATTRQSNASLLRQIMAPWRTVELAWTSLALGNVRMICRPLNFANSVGLGMSRNPVRLTFKVPSGLIEGQDLLSAQRTGTGTFTTGTIAGTARSYPLISFRGACTNPTLFLTAGASGPLLGYTNILWSNSTVLTTSQFAYLDMARKVMASTSGVALYRNLVVNPWGWLEPGFNHTGTVGGTVSSGITKVQWRTCWI